MDVNSTELGISAQKNKIGPPSIEPPVGGPGHVAESKQRTLDKAVPSTETKGPYRAGYIAEQKNKIGPPAVESQGAGPGHVAESKQRTLDNAVPSTEAYGSDKGPGYVTRQKEAQMAKVGPPSKSI